MASIFPVILSGGVGSRLWPLSRSLFPKQLLNLAGGGTLIQETALRVHGPRFAPPMIVCNQEHRFLIAEQLRTASVEPLDILLEPMGRNTAPAAAVAALRVAARDPEGLLLLMPADHVVRDRQAFLRAVDMAVEAAGRGCLVTFGIAPQGPETGYGYIQRGAPLPGSTQIFSVARFVEKPDRARAEFYLREGGYYWNSGLFAYKASAYLAELERLEPAMLAACRAALANGKADMDFFRLAE
jgi:mannose-1-phosphate guanylyltransferase/mannose-6-phosphate isomerase